MSFVNNLKRSMDIELSKRRMSRLFEAEERIVNKEMFIEDGLSEELSRQYAVLRKTLAETIQVEARYLAGL